MLAATNGVKMTSGDFVASWFVDFQFQNTVFTLIIITIFQFKTGHYR